MPDSMVWTSADDNLVIDFTDQVRFVVDPNGTRGLRSPSYSLASARYAGADGDTVDAVTAEPATPTIGLKMFATDEEDLRYRMRELVRALRPKAGPGTLTVTTPWGESRDLTCYCIGGLEGAESRGEIMPGRWWRVALKMHAPSPWWEGAERVIDFGLAAPSAFFPIFPLVLSPSTIQGEFTVFLADSDAPTYPTWTITGPGSQLTLTNLTTGRSIQVNAPLGDGQSMTIDTRPGFQSVTRDDGTNLMDTLATDPALWPLVDDVNVVSALLTNAGPASRIRGVYRPRFSGI